MAAAVLFLGTLSSCGVEEKTMEPVEVHGMAGIKNEHFYVGIYSQNGGINRIQNMTDKDLVNFVVGVDEFVGRETGAKWLGDVDFVYRIGGGDWQEASTAFSGDCRRVSKLGEQELRVDYDEASAEEKGIRHFTVNEAYRLEGEELVWQVTVRNTTDQPMEFGSIGFPLMFNSPLNGTVTEFYEQTTYAHSFVSYNGSYFYASRNCGDGPILLFYPKGGTSFEYQNWPEWPLNFECQTVYTVAGKTAADNPETASLPTSTLLLETGQAVTYTFGFAWADSFAEINTVLYEQDKVAVTSLPGMVTSTELPVSLDLYTKQQITAVESEFPEETIVRSLGAQDGHNCYELTFSRLGENRITVNYGDGLEMALIYFITEPLEELILKNCAFISEHQQQTDPNDPAYMGFLPWDMVMENLAGDGLTDEENNRLPEYFPTGWWHCGGDEMGYTPALYLSEKNVYWPDEKQIKQLVDYLNVFIYDTMTEIFPDGTHRLHRGAPWGILGTWDTDPRMDAAGRESNEDCWRSYNYPHVINTYYNLYRIAKYYDYDIDGMLSKEEYLLRAYELAFTFFTAWMYPLGSDERGQGGIHYGNMGESMFPELVRALQEEGYADKADWLRKQLEDKAAYYQDEPYPYTSESAFDTAAYEAVYAYAKMAGMEALAHEVSATNIATRGQTPVWYLYGSDLPSQDGGVTLRYMTQVGGWALLDYTLTYSENRAYDIRLAYGSYLAGWALINSGYYDDNPNNLYSSVWYYQGRKGETMHSVNSWEQILPLYNGGIPTSGESALGFWAALRMASTVVSQDPIFGLYAYGGTVEENSGIYAVIPKDGVRRRVHVLGTQQVISAELLQDRFDRVEIAADGSSLRASAENNTGTARTSMIRLTGFAQGEYIVTVNGETVGAVNIGEDESVTVAYTVPDGAAYELSIHQ